MDIIFECDKCGKKRVIKDALIVEMPHRGCGGTFRALSVPRVAKPKPKVLPSPNYDETSLMGFILRKYGHIPPETLKKYKVVQCRHCGNIQITTAKDRFICIYCNRSMKFRARGKWNVKLKDFDNLEDAVECCKLWKMEVEPKKIHLVRKKC